MTNQRPHLLLLINLIQQSIGVKKICRAITAEGLGVKYRPMIYIDF